MLKSLVVQIIYIWLHLKFLLMASLRLDRRLSLSRRRPLSYRNLSIDLRSKSMDWFLYHNGLRLERVKRLYTNINAFICEILPLDYYWSITRVYIKDVTKILKLKSVRFSSSYFAPDTN